MRIAKIILFAAMMLFSASVNAQIKEPSTFTKAEIDSTSYLLGINFGTFIRQYHINPIDYQQMNDGINDFISALGEPSGKEEFISQFKFNPTEMNSILNSFMEAESHTADEIEKASYMLGINFGSFIRGYDFPEPDLNTMLLGINDVLTSQDDPDDLGFGHDFKYAPELMGVVFTRILEKKERIALETNIYEGEVFMAQNAKAKGVKALASGMQYKIIKKGNKKHPNNDSDVTLLYTGTKLDGTVFDQTGNKPRQFLLGNLIEGWQQGLPLIGEGGEIMLYVPYKLGYGERSTGDIGPGQFLVFDIKLLEVYND